MKARRCAGLSGSQIEELWLRDNAIGDDGAQALALVLPETRLKRSCWIAKSIESRGLGAL